MTLIGTLWGDLGQRQTKVVLSVAAINGFELELPQPWSFLNKPADFMNKFTYGKIPAFEGRDGFKLTEGATIARYLSSIGENKVSLLGSNPQEAAIIDQWVHFAEHEIGTPTYNILYLVYGIMPFSRETLDKNTERLVRSLNYLEAHLAKRSSSYAVLDTLTLADVVLTGTIWHAASISLGSDERAQYPYIFAYYAKVAEDERMKQYWGTEQFVDVPITEPKPAPWS